MGSLGLASGHGEQLPLQIEPMLATLGELPANSNDFAYEFKWDGIRAIITIAPRVFKIQTRHGGEVTGAFPELHPMAASAGAKTLVLDGEIVSLDGRGRPRFNLLPSRMSKLA